MKQIIFIVSFTFALSFLVGCESDESGIFAPQESFQNDNGEIDPAAGENYEDFVENPFVEVNQEPISTFSIDADGGAYANIRRFLTKDNSLPPKGAVRVEEMINYFTFDYPETDGTHPFSITNEVGGCPWNTDHKLIQIGIKGKTTPKEQLPAANLVFLIDVSGSMSSDDKLPLLKEGFKLLVEELRPQDKVAIVTYAGAWGTVLEATSGDEKDKINSAINALSSGGGTNGEGGINGAYEIAQQNFVEGGNNRIIVATDGDFNIGRSSVEEIIDLIEEKRETGIFLTTLGFGTGNYNDAMLERLANNGNGTYQYIDGIEQARKVFIHDFGQLYSVAKDVKIQVEFDSTVVAAYRLIGYENRVLNNEDFEDDTKDAGELGNGQTVTAIYEIKLVPRPSYLGTLPLRVDFRYKQPDSDVSQLVEIQAIDEEKTWANTSESFRFTAAVAAFGMLLRDSEYVGNSTYDEVKNWANTARSFDPNGYRSEFITLIDKAKGL